MSADQDVGAGPQPIGSVAVLRRYPVKSMLGEDLTQAELSTGGFAGDRALALLDTGGPLTVTALEDGTIQAADLFTTDPTIEDKGFVVLEDPKNNFAAQNVVPLMNKAKATPQLAAALNAVSAKLTTDGLVDLNRQLNSPDKPNVESVAKEWLASNDL